MLSFGLAKMRDGELAYHLTMRCLEGRPKIPISIAPHGLAEHRQFGQTNDPRNTGTPGPIMMPVGVDISGLRLRIVRRVYAAAARCHGE